MTPVRRAGDGDFEEGGSSEPTQLSFIFQEDKLNRSMLDAMRDRSERSKKKRKPKWNKKWQKDYKPSPFRASLTDEIRDALSCGDDHCKDKELGRNTHCPVHKDGSPSLKIQAEYDEHGEAYHHGRVYFKCFAGCDPAEIEREIIALMGGGTDGN